MYVSMYSSPFPKLNPNVRYKTVLERAGFDVMYDTNNNKRNGALRTSNSTPNLKLKNTKKIEFFNKNFTNDNIVYNTNQSSNDKDAVTIKGGNSLVNLNDIESDFTSNSNINTSHEDSLFDFENNKYSDKDNRDINRDNSHLNELNDTRDTSDLVTEISNLKINFPMDMEQTPPQSNCNPNPNPNPDPSSQIELNEDSQNQSSQQTDLITDDINHESSDTQNREGVMEGQSNDEEDNISHSTSIYLSPSKNVDNNHTDNNNILSENPFNKDIDTISQIRPLSLLSENKISQEPQTIEPLYPSIQNTKTNRIHELIDQLNNSALPRENELDLINSVTSTSSLSSSSSSKLLSTGNTEKPKKSSYYLSGLPINNIEEISEAIEPTKTPIERPALKVEYKTGEGPCRLCHKEITSNARFAKELTGQWHRDCFRCIKCDQKFNRSNPCYILNDEPYCQMDYHIANNTICKICGIFIEGECLENDKEERFHVHCLTCFLCHEVIKNDYFLCNDNIPICDKHDINQLMVGDGNNEQEPSSTTDICTSTVEKRRTRLLNL